MTREEFKKKYGQILLPLVTPYNKKEEVSYVSYQQLITYLIENDLCDSFIVTGTTGEASLLSFEERINLMKTAVETVKGRKQIIAGTGCASTWETVKLTQEAEKLGIDLCMIVVPFYNKPTQEGIYRHFKTIAESVSCNIMLYNIPVFVGTNMEAETVRRLSKIPNIVGIKDEAGINPTQITDYILATQETDPEFVVFNGDDIMLLSTLVQGVMGIVSGGAHIFGHEIRKIFDAFEKGDYYKAEKLFLPLYQFCKCCGQNGRVLPNSIMRPAIEMVTGIPIGPARMPLEPIRESEIKILIETLNKIGVKIINKFI